MFLEEGTFVKVSQTPGRRLPRDLERYDGREGTIILLLQGQGFVVKFDNGEKKLFPSSNLSTYCNVLIERESVHLADKIGNDVSDLFSLPHWLNSKEKMKSYLEEHDNIAQIKVVKTYTLEEAWNRDGQKV